MAQPHLTTSLTSSSHRAKLTSQSQTQAPSQCTARQVLEGLAHWLVCMPWSTIRSMLKPSSAGSELQDQAQSSDHSNSTFPRLSTSTWEVLRIERSREPTQWAWRCPLKTRSKPPRANMLRATTSAGQRSATPSKNNVSQPDCEVATPWQEHR